MYIVAAARTPIGRFGGALKHWSPAELAAPLLRAVLEQARVRGDSLDLVLLGNVLRAGQGQLVARQAALKAGIPASVDAVSVDMVCSSGMMSVMTAASLIKAGDAQLILAGGTESMSSAGFFLSGKARWGYKYLPGPTESVVDVLHRDGLTDSLSGEAMGVQAERMVLESGASRNELDAIAAASHERAAHATQTGQFAEELVPLALQSRKGARTLMQDEGIRPDTSVEGLAALRPVFGKGGMLTAGNSSQISDGAAAVLLASEDAVQAHGLRVLAQLVSSAWASGEPWRFLEVPILASQRAMKLAGLVIDDIDLYENNEAFALSSFLFRWRLGALYEQLNVNGGAIALGHPIGCSGARILVTLVHAMRLRNQETGLAAICHGMGGGTSAILRCV